MTMNVYAHLIPTSDRRLDVIPDLIFSHALPDRRVAVSPFRTNSSTSVPETKFT